MPLSRLRLRLVARFALAFLIGLTLLNVALFAYLKHRADARLTDQLVHAVADLEVAIQTEARDADSPSLIHAARAALEEYPPRADAFVVVNASGEPIASRGPQAILDRIAPLPPLDSAITVDRATKSGVPLRMTMVPSTGGLRFAVVALESTQSLTEEISSLALWLALSIPTVSLIGVAVGYVLARGALRPIDDLGAAIASIAPEALGQRLPVHAPADEVDRVTAQFNQLLDRLETAQSRNRSFILRTAHQIRTPLTLLLGESELALDRSREPEQYRQALKRVHLAADQMRHRVEDLQLLAQAEAGERPVLTDLVELDGLLLECTDLIRGRAAASDQALEFGEVQPLTVQGSEQLLREAVLELLENACRHAEQLRPIRVTCVAHGSHAEVAITSSGPDATQQISNAIPRDDGTGLGLAIVRWIAGVHDGALLVEYLNCENTITLKLPLK